MGALEDRYREAVAALPYPPGDPRRAPLKQQLWDRYQAQLFLRRRRGGARVIHRAQQKFAVEYYRLLEQFYGGELTDTEYRTERRRTLRRYARRLVEAELLTEVFAPQWLRGFERDSLQLERRMLPVKDTGFTEEDAALLCTPLRDFSLQFFRKVHADFGVDRLKAEPEVFGGVDVTCTQQELQE